MSDGTRRIDVSLLPINYKDADGDWQPCDTTISASSKSGYSHENSKNAFESLFIAEGAGRGTVAVNDGPFGIEISPVGNAQADDLVEARISKDTVEYESLFASTSARYTVLPGMLKEELVLHDSKAPRVLRFRIKTDQLTPVLQENGNLAFFDAAGISHFVLLQPYANDSAPEPAFTNLTHAITRDGKDFLYEVTIDASWIEDPARVFPVIVDPTITTDDMAVDTYISSRFPTSSYTSSNVLNVSGIGTGYQEDALVRFNLPELGDGPAILAAQVYLYRTKYDGGYGSSIIHAYQITSDWTTAVTWNTRPTRAQTADSDTAADANNWIGFDVTETARKWYEDAVSNYGIQLVSTGTAGQNGSNLRSFYSRNEAQNTDCWPVLSIAYTYDDPRHSTYDLGQFANHAAQVTLDQGRLEVATTDLAVASWGPAATLSRCYSSKYQNSRVAPGWVFNFDRHLGPAIPYQGGFSYGQDVAYVDAANESHIFSWNGSSYDAPAGMIATLGQSGSNWVLTTKDRSVLTFDSSGKLLSEADRNGNTTTYTQTYSGYPISRLTTLTILAANGQSIVVNFNTSGKVTSANYTTSAGTRSVVYSTASPWTATYLSGTSLAHSVTYAITDVWVSMIETDHYLTQITASNYTGLAGNAQETFLYDANYKLIEARLPDYASTVPSYNNSNTNAKVAFAYNGSSCTATRWAAVRTGGTPTGATGTAITQVFDWNGHGTLDGRTNPKSSGSDQWWSYTYTENTGWLLSETSPLGKTRSWTYDNRGNILTQTDELGHVTSYTYPTSDTDPSRDSPLTVTSPSGAVTTYTYDSTGNVTHIERELNEDPVDNLAKTNFTYTNVTVGSKTYYKALTRAQKLISGTTWATTDYNLGGYYPNGAPAQTVYQDVVREQGGTPVDLTATATYDAFGNLLTSTDTSGQVVQTNVYDIAGHVTLSTSAPFTATVNGVPTTTQIVQHNTWDNWGHLTATYLTSTADTSGAKVNWQTTAYDASGRVSTVTSRLWTASVPAGQVQSVVTYRYDGKGRQITAADSTMSGLPALNAYDAIGNVVESWAAGVTSYTDAKADRALLADGVTPAFDAVGNALRAIAAGNSAAATCTYTDANQVLRATAADGTWIEYEYDNLGNITDTLRSNGATTGATYDMGGRCLSATGENGLTTSFSYDCLGRTTGAQAAGQTASTVTYNSLGWALASLEADGTTASSVYDQVGRVLETTVAGNTSTATYDTAGNLTHQVDPGDRWTDTYYDLFGRVCRVTQTLPGSPRITVKDQTAVFDSLSRPTSGSDNLQELASSWSYPLNTPAVRTGVLTAGSGADQVQTTLTIGADGLETNRQTVVASSPQIPTLLRSIDTRDDGRRVTKTTLSTGSGSVISQYSYDAVGRLKRQWGTTGGGSGFTAAAESTDAYGYDPSSGLKTSENICLAAVGTAGTITASYSYSADGRLTSATTNGRTVGYSFDALGNLSTISPQGENPTTYTYDSGNRLQTAVNAGVNTYFSWDAVNGRRTSQGPTSNELDPRIRYTYTETGRLAGYSNELVSPGIGATYSYDSAGQRTQSTVTSGTQTTTSTFTYDGLGLVSLTATQSGGVENDSWQFTYLYTGGGRPYAAIYRDPSSSSSPLVFGIVTTDRGDVVALLDAAGNPFAAYRYDAWGNPQGAGNVATGVWSQVTALVDQALAADIASRQPLRYAGYCYDSESGLYYLSARPYDSRTGQFLTKDPVRSDGEESPYQYCTSRPIACTDPSGMNPYQESYPDAKPVVRPLRESVTLATAQYWYSLNPSLETLNVIAECYLLPEDVLNWICDTFENKYYDENAPLPGEGIVAGARSDPDGYSQISKMVTVENIKKYGVSYLLAIMRNCAAVARHETEGMSLLDKCNWLKDQFRIRGDWDFKLLPGAKTDSGEWVEFAWIDNQSITLETFGNMLLGYVANAIDVGPGECHFGSFLAWCRSDNFPRGFWDEQTDECEISLGYDVYPRFGYSKNSTIFYYHRQLRVDDYRGGWPIA